jgi:hypothetical protein
MSVSRNEFRLHSIQGFSQGLLGKFNYLGRACVGISTNAGPCRPVNLICRKRVFAHWYYAIFWSAEDLGRKRMGYTVTALKSGPVHIVALGCALTATFVLLYVLCFLAAVLFPNAALTHAWLGLYCDRAGRLC